MSEWAITPEQKFDFLRLLVEVFEEDGQLYGFSYNSMTMHGSILSSPSSHRTTSYQFLLASLRNLPPNSPRAESSAIQAISTSLKLPSVFDFDTLFKVDAVIKLQGHELFSLLRVFLSGGLEDYKTWESEHPGSIEEYGDCTHCRGSQGLMLIFGFIPGLDKAQLERKIRLLTLTSLGFQNIGKDVPYATLASALQVDQSEVEKWVIDGTLLPLIHTFILPTSCLVIRAGLVSGKLSQSSKVFHITRSTSRLFEREQWAALEQRLVAWQTGLAAVLAVVTSAREKGNERSIGDNGFKTASTEPAAQTQSVAT